MKLTQGRILSAKKQNLVPPLKWAGGKRWLLPHLRSIWSNHSDRRLIEPFCGGLAVSLGLNPSEAILNDINPHLINLYEKIQSGLKISIPMHNSKLLYSNYRNHFNNLISTGRHNTIEAASIFYYLNRTGFNGLCRFNNSGFFNVPFGTYKNINYLTDFSDYKPVFKPWTFSSVDFEKIPIDTYDFIYADPPYDVEFTKYSKEGFSWDDQVRLIKWLSKHKGPVVISNQATERILKIYKKSGYTIQLINAPRRISCNGDRKPALEVLAYRNI